MKHTLMAVALTASTMTAFALPSVDAVRAEVAQGHEAQAEHMISEVIAARPDSARARYVHAEILAHQGRFAQAAGEAAQARRLDPSLSFTQADTFKTFEAMLAREQSAAASLRTPASVMHTAPAERSGGVPGWVWGGGLALLAAVVLSRLAAARQPSPMAAPAGLTPLAAAPGVGALPTGYGMAPAVPAASTGGSLLGTGLAVAGGMAAGALAERLLDGRHEPAAGSFWTPAPAPMNFEPLDGQASEIAAARALEERPIDMGTGDDWGGTDAGGSVGSDGW